MARPNFPCIEFTEAQRNAVVARNFGRHQINPWLATNGKYYIAEIVIREIHSEAVRNFVSGLPRVMRDDIIMYDREADFRDAEERPGGPR